MYKPDDDAPSVPHSLYVTMYVYRQLHSLLSVSLPIPEAAIGGLSEHTQMQQQQKQQPHHFQP